MRQYDTLRGVTRRELNIRYRSPLICQIAVPFSVSGSAMIACVPVFRHLAPSGFTASADECESVVLSWNESEGAFGYTVARSESENGPWTPILDLAPDLSFTDSVPAGTYFYRVNAVFTDTGASEPSVIGPVAVSSC